jgi:hypothetical protein
VSALQQGTPAVKGVRPEALYRVAVVAPVLCCVFSGFAIIGRQGRGWVELGYWPSIAFHDVIDWWVGHPISSNRLAAGLLNLIGNSESDDLTEKKMAMLSAVVHWLVDGIPLSIWLVMVFPILWFLILRVTFRVVGSLTRSH